MAASAAALKWRAKLEELKEILNVPRGLTDADAIEAIFDKLGLGRTGGTMRAMVEAASREIDRLTMNTLEELKNFYSIKEERPRVAMERINAQLGLPNTGTLKSMVEAAAQSAEIAIVQVSPASGPPCLPRNCLHSPFRLAWPRG